MNKLDKIRCLAVTLTQVMRKMEGEVKAKQNFEKILWGIEDDFGIIGQAHRP